jgi:putative redox protein
MATERIEFTNAKGVALAGALELPPGRVRGAALFAHCFTCTKQSRAATRITRALAQIGIATLRFDFTGLGGSDGDFAHGGFASDVGDVISGAAFLEERFGEGVLLIGHSLGGAAVLAAAQHVSHVHAVATIGAPSDVPHVLEQFSGDLAAIERDGEGDVEIAGRPFRIGRSFIESVRGADVLSAVRAMKQPLLIMHAPTDEVVSVDHARKLYEAAFHPKSFVSPDDADHLMVRDRDAVYAASVIAAWAERYLPAAEPRAPEEGVLAEMGHGKFGTQLYAGSHAWVADEPKSYGGEDLGPTPYDMLNAALATCTVMTMKMYADRKKLPLTRAEVIVTHERNHADDCEQVMEEDDMPTQALYKQIRLGGDLTAEQHAKLLEIAEKCPVNRTLKGKLHIHMKE